jgi:hypothetical protein
MCVGVPYTIETPKKGIPSLVWLETGQKWADRRWVPTEAFTIQFSQNALGVLREGESGVVRVTAAKTNGRGINSVVQGVSEVGSSVLNDRSDLPGNRCGKPDFMHILAGVRVELDETGVWLTLKEAADLGPCLLDVFAATLD